MQDSTLSETGSNLVFEDESQLCESKSVDLKDVWILFCASWRLMFYIFIKYEKPNDVEMVLK